MIGNYGAIKSLNFFKRIAHFIVVKEASTFEKS